MDKTVFNEHLLDLKKQVIKVELRITVTHQMTLILVTKIHILNISMKTKTPVAPNVKDN